MKLSFFTVLTLLSYSIAHAQVVSINPVFATQNDTVTITFDATQGNGALVGVAQVYAHTGVITDLSPSPTSWRHVVGNWGTPDPTVAMQNIGNNKHTISYHINTFYNVPSNEVVERLGFVFRNANGSLVGRDANGSDIFVDIYSNEFAAAILSPQVNGSIVSSGDTVFVQAASSDTSDLVLQLNGTNLTTIQDGKNINFSIPVDNYGPGKYWIELMADNGDTILYDSVYFIYPGSVTIEALPSGIIQGVNVIDSNSITLRLFAPGKSFVFAIGDFSNWELDTTYYMKRTPDQSTYWLQIDNLDPNQEYRFQYQIENEMRVADVYSEKILDPFNDPFIAQSTYPNLTPYPTGRTTDPVSVFKINSDVYPWDSTMNYQKPDKNNLVIYELLVRDFVANHDYNTIRDTLDYLENLGITAIEFMPINEFEGNLSWGYNPSFYFAPDKYYGPKETLQAFIEECHRRDIAVIIDIALNHSFGQNPQVRMYFDPSIGPYGQTTPQSPWFNPVPKHDFNVGYDYNHESQATQQFVDRVLAHWVNEYRIDGFRMDLSKGFTQINSLGNIGAWSAYDQSRIDIWQRIGNAIWSVDSTTIMILEHFADNNEEQVLSDLGFMLWGNCNHDYNEATMGYPSNLNCISYQFRNWNDPNLIGYMESHDEERLMYKNINFGNSSGNYDVTNFNTALRRIELASNFFIPIPGPKMIWQFGELGYEFSINRCPDGTINNDCRTSEKPIRWDFYTMANRKRVYDVMSALNNLKKDHPTFQTTNFSGSLGGFAKRLHLTHDSMDVTILGNFDVNSRTIIPNFQHTGMWYEYYSGDSLMVNNVNDTIALAAGEYLFYTDRRLQLPAIATSLEDKMVQGKLASRIFPNPSNTTFEIEWYSNNAESFLIEIFDILGQKIEEQKVEGTKGINRYEFTNTQLEEGTYIINIRNEELRASHRFVWMN